MKVSKNKTMIEKNILKSDKFINESHIFHKIHARVNSDNVMLAGTPYPFLETTERNFVVNGNFGYETATGVKEALYSTASTTIIGPADGKEYQQNARTNISFKKEEGKSFLSINFDGTKVNGRALRTNTFFNLHELIPFSSLYGKPLSLSFDFRVDTPDVERIMLTHGYRNSNNNLNQYKLIQPVLHEVDKWYRYECTFDIKSFKTSTENIGISVFTTNDPFMTIDITNVMFEIGPVTPFSLAPEDGGRAPGESIDRLGLCFEDIDFNHPHNSEGDSDGALMISGSVNEKALPLEIFDLTKKQLKNINFL